MTKMQTLPSDTMTLFVNVSTAENYNSIHRKATWSLKLITEKEKQNQKCIHNQTNNIQLVLARFEPVQNALGNEVCEWKALFFILNHGKKTENQLTATAENNVLIICIANILV